MFHWFVKLMIAITYSWKLNLDLQSQVTSFPSALATKQLQFIAKMWSAYQESCSECLLLKKLGPFLWTNAWTIKLAPLSCLVNIYGALPMGALSQDDLHVAAGQSANPVWSILY